MAHVIRHGHRQNAFPAFAELLPASVAQRVRYAAWLTWRRGALADVINGNLVSAIQKCNKEWASLPGSPYNQNPVSQATFETYYASNGGTQADAGALV